VLSRVVHAAAEYQSQRDHALARMIISELAAALRRKR
jgi:hypothetical protein